MDFNLTLLRECCRCSTEGKALEVMHLLFSSNRRRIVHMSGESLVALSSHDGRVRLIDMEAAQERPMTLIGHAASVHCIVVQEEKKRIFTVSLRAGRSGWTLPFSIRAATI